MPRMVNGAWDFSDGQDDAPAPRSTAPRAAAPAKGPPKPVPAGRGLDFSQGGEGKASGRYSADYAREKAKAKAERGRQANMGAFGVAAHQAPIPILDEINAGARATGAFFGNIGRRARGEAEVDPEAIWLAQLDADKEISDEQRRKHPVAALAGGVLTGLPAAAETAAVNLGARAVGATGKLMQHGANTVKAAAAGVPAGAAYGFLDAGATPEERGRGFALGGAVGGATAGLLTGVAAPALGAVAKKTAPIIAEIFKGKTPEKKAAALKIAQQQAQEAATPRPSPLNALPGPIRPASSPAELASRLVKPAGVVPKAPADRMAASQVAARLQRPPQDIAREEAEAVATELARKAGLRSAADVHAKAADEFQGLDVRGAELSGKGGEGMLESLSRRPGDTPDAATLMAVQREHARPDQIVQSATDDLGIDPHAARGDINQTIIDMEARSKSAFDEAFPPGDYDAPGVLNPELERILRRPAVQSAMREANVSEQNWGRDAEGLAFGRVEVPRGEQFAPDAPPVGERIIRPGDEAPILPPAAEVKIPRAPSEQPSRGFSLLNWLRRQGGVSHEADEMAVMDLVDVGKYSTMEPQQLDVLTQRARDAGYFQDIPSHKEFLEAIREGNAGRHRYAREADPLAQQRFDAGEAARAQQRHLESQQAIAQAESDDAFKAKQAADLEASAAWERHMQEVGDDPDYWRSLETGTEAPPNAGEGPSPNAPPDYEPAYTTAPTARAWDAIRRKLNESIDWKPSTPEARKQSGDIAPVAKELTRILAGDENTQPAIPHLREALDRGGEPIRVREVFRDFKGAMFKNSHDFKNAWLRLKHGKDGKPLPAEVKAAQAAMANDIFEMWGKGKLSGGKFDTPFVRSNLEHAFGKDQADAFIRKMEVHARLAASNKRFMTNSGSQTAKLLQANEGAPQGGGAQEAIGLALQAKGSPLSAAITFLARKWDRAGANIRTGELSEATRNELGKILMMPPDEFGRVLERIPAPMRPALIDARRTATALASSHPDVSEREEQPY